VLQSTIGRNQKHILVVYREDKGKEELKQLLEKILTAAKFNVAEDVLLLNLPSKESFSFTALKGKVEIKEVLLFGVDPKLLGLNFDQAYYQPFEHLNCRYLFADDLSKISTNQQLKGNLWNCLKEMYL